MLTTKLYKHIYENKEFSAFYAGLDFHRPDVSERLQEQLQKWNVKHPITEYKMADESFINLYLDYTKELESSTAFFRWSAYACVAALMRDNCFLPDGPGQIYPNIYVLLLADSAMHRKARGPNLTVDILREINNTKIIQGRTSIQSVIEDLGNIQPSKTTGVPIKGGSCIMIADELASFIVSDPQAVPILTDLYDFRKEWTSHLKGSGKTKVNNLCVSILAGSNEEHLKSVYTSAAVFGGLLGRTFFVKPDEFRPGNTLFGRDTGNGHYNPKPLFEAARRISKVKGEFQVDPAAQAIYEDWYHPWRETAVKNPDRTGVLGRLHTGVKKIAMILCIADSYSLTIRQHHVEEAISRCYALLPNYRSYSMSAGKSILANAMSIILSTMYDRKDRAISHMEFMQSHWAEIDEDTFKKAIAALQGMRYVTAVPRGAECSYIMTKLAIDYFSQKVAAAAKEAKT